MTQERNSSIVLSRRTLTKFWYAFSFPNRRKRQHLRGLPMKTKLRTLLGAVMAASALLLAACGGGGGSTATTTTPTPTADTQKPTISATAVTPMTLTQTFVVKADEPVNGTGFAVTVKNGGTDVAFSNVFGTDGKSATISPATQWPAGAVLNVTVSTTDLAGNVGTATFAVSTVAAPVVTLDSYVKPVAVWFGGYPTAVSKTSITLAINSTGFGNIIGCGAANKPLPDGYVLYNCNLDFAAVKAPVKYDPVTNTLTKYVGAVPADITFTYTDGTEVASVADGAFSISSSGVDLRFTPTGGGVTTVFTSNIATQGVFSLVRTYTYTKP